MIDFDDMFFNSLIDSKFQKNQKKEEILEYLIFSTELMIKKVNNMKNNSMNNSKIEIKLSELNYFFNEEVLRALLKFINDFAQKTYKIRFIKEGFRFYQFRPIGIINKARFQRQK